MSVGTVHQSATATVGPPFWRRLRRLGHYGLRAAKLVVIAAIAFLVAGFFRFTDKVAHLNVPPELQRYEAIVALTGGYQRIEKALDLLEGGVGKRLLISGVNPVTSGHAIKRATGANSDLFACCVDIGYQAIDTIGNANEAASWIAKNGYRRVLVVTNNYHIPRSLLELTEVMPEVEFAGFPVTHSDLTADTWMSDPMAVRTLATEYVKYSLAKLRSWAGASTATGLRAGYPEPAPALTASLAR